MRPFPTGIRARRRGGADGTRLTLLQRFALTSLFAITVLGLVVSYSLGRSIESSALSDARAVAYDDLHGSLNNALGTYDFKGPLSRAQWKSLAWQFGNSVRSSRTVVIKLWGADGRVLFTTDRAILGKRFPVEGGLKTALTGKVASDVSSLDEDENRDLQRRFGRLFEVYIPVSRGGRVVGAFEIYQVFKPVGDRIAMLQRTVYGMLAVGLLVLYLLLFGIVRRGSNTIVRQQHEVMRYTTDLERSYNETIGSLAAAVDARDATTERHSQRVTELAVSLGRWIGMGEGELRDLERGALLHDVGKIGVSDLILLKPGKLTDEEWVQMRQHPLIGHEMLQNVSFLQGALPVVRHHHERWDGTGYPDRLRGEWIPKPARLFAVIDVYDALTSERPYRQPMPHQEAIAVLHADAGSHFDAAMVEAFDAMMQSRQIMETRVHDLVALRGSSRELPLTVSGG